MDLVFENFLGRNLKIPGDLLYEPTEGLWIRKQDDGKLGVGLTEATVVFGGTIRQIEILVESNTRISRGDTAILALTSKLKYIAGPVSGVLIYPPDLDSLPERIMQDPYAAPIFYVVPESDPTEGLVDASAYMESLKDSDGARNPGGHKGGVSPTCKAVYMGLAEQKIKD